MARDGAMRILAPLTKLGGSRVARTWVSFSLCEASRFIHRSMIERQAAVRLVAYRATAPVWFSTAGEPIPINHPAMPML
jgi:hypothetical protein